MIGQHPDNRLRRDRVSAAAIDMKLPSDAQGFNWSRREVVVGLQRLMKGRVGHDGVAQASPCQLKTQRKRFSFKSVAVRAAGASHRILHVFADDVRSAGENEVGDAESSQRYRRVEPQSRFTVSDEKKLLMEERDRGERVGRPFARRHHGRIHRAAFHPVSDRVVDAFVHPQICLGCVAQDVGGEWRGHQALEGERHGKIETARCPLTDVVAKRMQFTEDGPGTIDQHLSGVGRPDALPGSDQKRRAGFMLQKREPPGKGGLRHPQIRSGLIDTPQLDDAQEILDLSGFHHISRLWAVIQNRYNEHSVMLSALERKSVVFDLVTPYDEAPLIELYNAPVSTCSQKVRMALWEKDLSWQDRQISFQKNDHLSDWYLAINPNGVVPSLVHDGRTVIDSSVINEYLEDTFPERPLRPKSAIDAAHMREWRQYIDEVPTVAIRYPSFNAAFVHIWQDMSEEEHAKYVDRRPLRKHFYRRMGRDGFPKEDVDAALDMLRMTVERMQAALEKFEWLANDAFTLADISMMPNIVRMDDLGLAHLWADLPKVADWYGRVQARPAFEKTYSARSRDIHPSC
jgi:glutathione S-transferase